MSLAHFSELLLFLNQIDAQPRKGLSQNFLIDENIVRKIVQSAAITKDDRVLEIGPGPGALTQELLKSQAHVIAIEKDRRLAHALSRLQIENRLEVISGDFLEIDLSILKKHAPLKIVANLPYHITTPIIERLCEHHSLFSSAFIMVQKEMAQRIVASPNTKEISSFSIFVKTYSKPSIALKISRNCFYPAPTVDSCIVKLDFHSPLMDDPKSFTEMVRTAYQQRRKMLRSTLKNIDEPFASRRPEALSFDEWLSLFNIRKYVRVGSTID